MFYWLFYRFEQERCASLSHLASSSFTAPSYSQQRFEPQELDRPPLSAGFISVVLVVNMDVVVIVVTEVNMDVVVMVVIDVNMENVVMVVIVVGHRGHFGQRGHHDHLDHIE